MSAIIDEQNFSKTVIWRMKLSESSKTSVRTTANSEKVIQN